jgi:predicted ester cyclase
VSPKAVVEDYLLGVLGGSKEVSAEAVVASEDLRRRTEILSGAFPDLEVDVVALVAEGDLVAAHLHARGTHLGLYQGTPPTGRRCEMRCTGVYRVEGGRIAEAFVTWDTLSLMEQLGAVERVAAVSA